METEIKKAVIYCRVSTKEQVDDGNSLSTQEKICKGYALQNGYDIAEIFIEQGESAKTAERAELQRMLAYCELHKNISAVITYKLDRISRNTDDYSQIRLKLKKHNVEIKSTSEFFENNPAGRFMENIIANVAQFDNDVRTERSLGGMKEAVRDGRYVWMAPIGYRNIKIGGRATIVQDDIAPIVLKAFETVAKNLEPTEEIRRKMISQGLVNSRGKPIATSYFYTMLRNELYAGWIIKFGERHKGLFTPIISEELFNQVQRVLRYRKHNTWQYVLDNPDFPLRRFIKHPLGRHLTGAWSKGRSKKYAYYRFHKPSQQFKKEIVEKTFRQFLDSYELEEKHFKALRIYFRKHFSKALKEESKEKTRLESQISDLKKKQTLLIEKNLQGIISNDLLKEQLKEVDVAYMDAYSSLMLVQDQYEIDIETLNKRLQTYLRKPSEIWNAASLAAKRQLQWFYFPSGITFDGKNCKTAEICSVFKLKQTISDILSTRVHSSISASNHIPKNTLNVKRAFGKFSKLEKPPLEIDLNKICKEVQKLEDILQSKL